MNCTPITRKPSGAAGEIGVSFGSEIWYQMWAWLHQQGDWRGNTDADLAAELSSVIGKRVSPAAAAELRRLWRHSHDQR